MLRDDELVDLGAHRQRTLLAVLLTRTNNVVAMDEILEALWGEDGASTKQNALWVYISGLRKALEPEREKRTDGTVVLTRSPGYVLAATDDAVDAARFEKLVAEGRALGETDPAAASLVLGEALALWRGKPYEDFTYDSFFQDEIARLNELRLEAVEIRIEVDLKRGMAHELVSELESLVRQNPLRERLTGQLMLALYRSGRQAESLRAYKALQNRLGEEIGIEPSASIRRLEEQIVTADPALDSTAGAAAAGFGTQGGLTIRGYELREKIGEGAFGIAYRAYQPAVGREVAIKVIRPELADDPAFIRRFEAEAQLVAQLEHPHIVPLYDYWREPGAAYLVMRLMKGGSLDQVLETSALAGDHALRVADQMAGALQTAHDHGVVHRDIKPSNILIDDEGNAYLSDFGIAVGTDGGMSTEPSVSGTLAAPYAAPEQLGEGNVSPASDVYSLGVVLAQALTGLRGEVPQIRGALGAGLTPVIDRATDPERSRRYQDARSFANDFGRGLGAGIDDGEPPPRIEVENPYKGLRSFNAIDAADFFGRERLIDRLVFRLGEPGRRGRFVALVGPSGSGKSSVVKAGLRPALARGAVPLSEEWFNVEMVPAPHPFEELEAALLAVAVDPPPLLLEQLTSAPAGLHHALHAMLPDDHSQLLLVIDQFEELFTQVDDETADRFLEALVHAVTAESSRLRVVVTLRADFYDRPLRHRALGELLREGTEVITPMSAEEIERAIVGPAERRNVIFEPALVARLIHDVADRPSVLPLLQYTLTELFEARSTSRITADAYDDLGGVSGALVKRAEGILTGLSSSGQDAARLVLLRLVTLGEGAEDTRRRVLLGELEELPLAPSDLRVVLDTFGRHRLLSFDRDPVSRSPSVEIAHETMLTEWGRLRDWIDGARHDVRNQRRLADAMAEWQTANGSDAYLLRGGRLEQLRGWAMTTSLPLSDVEQSFLDASIAERNRAERDEREREQRTVDAEAQARQRARQLTGAGVVGVLVAALAAFGIWQWRATEVAKADNDRLVLAAEYRAAADSALADDPELSLLYAIEAVRATSGLGFATEEAVDSLHWALQRQGVQYPVGFTASATVRSGPAGLTGVFVLAPAELVALGEASTERRLTDAECRSATELECTEPSTLDSDLPLRFGAENYAVDIPEVLPGVPAFGEGRLAGTRVTLAAIGNVASTPGLRAELDRFTELSGIEVELLSNYDFDLTRALSTGQVTSFPDIAGFFQPPEPWAQARAVDLSTFMDEQTLRTDFSDHLVDLMTSETPDGPELHGLPMNVHPKGLVYYPKRAFETAGYEIPATWDELVELSQQMVDDGRTPWCFQWEAGFASGFLGSDYLESLVIRVGGVDVYDEWSAGERPFDSPEIVEAAQRGEEVLFGPGFVLGGVDSISRTDWPTVMTKLLAVDPFTGAEGPQCWLVHHLAQLPDLLGSDIGMGSSWRVGEDVDFFMLPPVIGSAPAPVFGSGLIGTAMTDRPEIRALMHYIASPQWGEVWAGVERDTFFSSNRRFDTASYAGIVGPETGRTEPRDQGETEFRVAIHDVQRAALDADTWRYDASDLMPTTFGAWTEDFVPGPFWQGMVDWVDRVKPISEILADIDADRVATYGDNGW
ncbi:MAG: extracellular solute-binding protein [Acidimicrobiales bacterium]